MRPFRALIFDLDGVIIDTEPKHKEAKQAAFARFGLDVPEALYDAFRGRSDEDMARHVVREFGPAGLEWSQVLALKHELFYGLEHAIEPVPGALEFIRAARARFEKLAVATSATARNQRYAFDRFGLSPFFDVVVNAGDITHAKPHPEVYLAAADRLGLPAEACLVIEDSKNGIASAQAAGCKAAAVTTSFTRGELAGSGADFIMDRFEELAEILRF
jgi:HAD superfamily hydrolase (TIGR01509 family)